MANLYDDDNLPGGGDLTELTERLRLTIDEGTRAGARIKVVGGFAVDLR